MPRTSHKKRPDGCYEKKIMVGYHPNGKPDRRTVYGRTHFELDENVIALREELKRAQEEAERPEEIAITVGECAAIWLELNIKGPGDLRKNTVKMYESCIRNRLETINDLSIQDLCVDDYMRIRNSIRGKERALEIFEITLRQILDYAVSNGYITKNFLDDEHNKRSDRRKRKKAKQEKATEGAKRSLSDEKVRDILSLRLPPRTRIYIIILHYTGVRRGEAWALKKSDFDFKGMILNVNKTALSGKPYNEGPPKSKKHDVPVPPELARELKSYFASHPEEYIFAEAGEDTPPPYHKIDVMWYEFIRIYNESKGGTPDERKIADDITPHIFRHTFATNMYYAGVDFMTTLEWLGDGDLNMLLKIYTHPDKEYEKKAAAHKYFEHMDKKLLLSDA